MKKYIILLLALCSMSACDYEAVNTNPYGVSDGELGPLKYGARFMNMQQRVIPIGSPLRISKRIFFIWALCWPMIFR